MALDSCLCDSGFVGISCSIQANIYDTITLVLPASVFVNPTVRDQITGQLQTLLTPQFPTYQAVFFSFTIPFGATYSDYTFGVFDTATSTYLVYSQLLVVEVGQCVSPEVALDLTAL